MEEKSNLEFMQKRTWSYTAPWEKVDRWPNLTFEGGARAKFGVVCGYVAALADGLKTDLASALADAFCKRIDYLNGYGGQEEITPDDLPLNRGPLHFPHYKIVLHDDGTWGGFGVMAYVGMSNERLHEIATKIQDEQPVMEVVAEGRDEQDRWRAALAKARERLRLKGDLEESRAYRSKHDTEGRWPFNYAFRHYGFSWNGGLICHGVDRHSGFAAYEPEKVREYNPWSLHT